MNIYSFMKLNLSTKKQKDGIAHNWLASMIYRE